MTPEGVVKQQIKNYLKENGYWFFMPMGTAYGRTGVPDFVCCKDGRLIAIEAKAGDKKPSPMQALEMESIREHGGVAICINAENVNVIGEEIDSALGASHDKTK